MVGIFSRFSVTKSGHRRAQSALDERQVLPRKLEETVATDLGGASTATATATAHGVEAALGFKPVERPNEPLDNESPIQCPLPEPSILNDGRIWKERVSTVRKPADLAAVDSEAGSTTRRRPILPSISAPEHSILGLLEESEV